MCICLWGGGVRVCIRVCVNVGVDVRAHLLPFYKNVHIGVPVCGYECACVWI